ncbi:MAG: DUF4923 family protein [Bacteroides sp.]|nr:DUF4923 family protein [Bacteroides sp.]MCM1379492.1 DUF4923 family protein [Bacteroides sp.]MCM1445905.1 DUF4923 family protein [Prevotella sp.]
MKRVLSLVCVASLALSACASPLATTAVAPSQAPATTNTTTRVNDNPLGALGGLLGGGKSSNSSSDNNSGSALGNILGGVLGSVLGSDKITPERMVGTWNYSGPAVCFKSENFLQKAGGAAMAATIENKLADYYTKFGLTKVTLVVDEQQNFQLNFGVLKTMGTISIEDEDVYFNFTALGAISLGKMKTYVTMTGNNQMSLMFDVTKLMNIVTAVASKSSSSAIGAATSLLNSYDGLCAGFKLTK